MSGLNAVILAAGKGTRMKSALPKVLHQVGGKPMVQHVLDAAKIAGATNSVAVVGFGAEQVKAVLGNQVQYALQQEQLGTGHAVMQTADGLADFEGTVMILCGDTPLLRGQVLAELYRQHLNTGAVATVLTARMPDPKGYGRVIRDAAGKVVKIVEQKDASPQELLVNEVNTGIYCFDRSYLFDALTRINCNNMQGEYYLTDVIGIIVQDGKKVWAVEAENYQETLGINSRVQLAEAEKILRVRKLNSLMDNGVTVMDPDSTFIDEAVQIGPDTVIYPFTWLEGSTVIGSNCEIGPNTRIQDTTIGNGAVVHFTYAHDCKMGDNVIVGPYVHLRPDTVLGTSVKVGNFVEVKNSSIGDKSKLPHLSYIGDTDMGSGVNIGCGTITVNYDGKKKHRTIIGDNAFVGCNSNLVAPVKVGDSAYIGAGSTITKEVPENSLAVARARQSNIAGWVNKHNSK